MQREHIFKIIKIIFPLILLVLTGLEIKKAAMGINIDLLQYEVNQLPFWQIPLIFILSICAITPMFLYDIMLVKLLGIQVSQKKLVKQSFIVNTISNLIGFGGIAGLMLRNYFYTKYDVNKQVLLRNIASVTIFSLTGISLLAMILPISYRNFPLLNETKWLFIAVIGVSLCLPMFILFYWIQHKRNSSSAISLQMFVKLVLASLLEWISVFCVICFFAYVLNIPIQLTDLFPVFIIATCAGVASMIPGGVGSFDLVFIWGTQSLGIMDEKVFVLLIFYRMSYLIFPFLLSVALFYKEIWRKVDSFLEQCAKFLLSGN